MNTSIPNQYRQSGDQLPAVRTLSYVVISSIRRLDRGTIVLRWGPVPKNASMVTNDLPCVQLIAQREESERGADTLLFHALVSVEKL